MITQEQSDGLCKLIIDALPPGDIDGPTQKMLLLAIKIIKGAVPPKEQPELDQEKPFMV